MARMSEFDTVQIIALLGWLILCGAALASRKLSCRKGLSMALIWVAIFVGVALFISVVS